MPEYKGQGYGKKLYHDFYAVMHENGKKYVKFYSDIGSVGFYNSLGYKWLGFSKSEQIPWTICKIQSNDCVADCAEFYPSIGYHDHTVMKEHSAIANKVLSAVKIKRVLNVLSEIAPNFIEITEDSVEKFFSESA